LKFDVEVGFISKLLQTKDILTVKDSQIKSSFFTGDNRPVYDYIYDTFMETGEVPSVRALKRQFPRYKLETTVVDGEEVVGTEENLKYWCTELRKKVRHNYIAESVEKVADKLQDFDSEEAYSLMKKSIAYIESEVTETSDIDITKDTESRKEAYLKKKQNKGMQGLPTGFKKLDYITKGLKDETLTTIIANTGVGKTWLEIIIGSYLQLHNYRVLQGVTEMSEDIMRDRYEATLFSMCYGEEFNYNAFKSGALSLKAEKLYFEFLENDLPNFEPLYITTATGVMGLSADIDKYDPDVIFIDSAYLMEDDQGAKDDWLRVAHITRDLKKLAKRCKKPIIINTQADKNTSKKTGPELGSIMYTQAIGQDSDDIWALFRDDIMRNDNEMALKILKQREGNLGRIMMNWNFDTMDFSEIYSDNQSDFEEEESGDEKSSKDNTLDIM
jgi:replicative DNA helicase